MDESKKNRPLSLWERVTRTLLTRARRLRRKPSEAEKKLWYHLRNRRFLGYKFRRQFAIGQYIVDFACLEAKLIV